MTEWRHGQTASHPTVDVLPSVAETRDAGSKWNRQEMAPPKTILSAGHNIALLKARNAVIQAAGYQVVTTKESNLLLEMASKREFAAIVICNSMPAHLRRNVVKELKRIKPDLPLVVICAYTEQLEFRKLVEEVVIAEHGVSQPLLEAISKVAGEPALESELSKARVPPKSA